VQKKYLYGGAAAFLILLIVWAISTAPQPPTSSEVSDAPRIMSYENNTLSEERDGRTVWTLTAQQMTVDIDTQDTSMQGIEGTFYSEDGRTLTLHADEGHMDHETRDVVLTGSVNAAMSDGASLMANELKWTSTEGTLTATGDAQVERDDLRATGDRIMSMDEFRQFRIEGNARIEKGASK